MERIVVVLCAAIAVMVPQIARAQQPSVMPVVREGETLVLVEAEGIAKVKPDFMTISAGVVTTGSTAKQSVDENNRKMSAVLTALRSAGIRPTEVRTEDFRVTPKFSDDDEREIATYEVRNTVQIELRDFARAGDTISALFDAGANNVSGPLFNVDDNTYSTAASAAETDALRAARRQADTIAGQLGLRVSRVLRVSNREIKFSRDYGERNGGMIVVTGSRIAPTPIEPGEMDFEVELFVEFALVSS